MEKIHFDNNDEIFEIIPDILEYLPEYIVEMFKKNGIQSKDAVSTFLLKKMQEITKIRWPELTKEEIIDLLKK